MPGSLSKDCVEKSTKIATADDDVVVVAGVEETPSTVIIDDIESQQTQDFLAGNIAFAKGFLAYKQN